MSGTSYTNIFGGNVVIPADQSFIQYTLTSLISQIILTWPSQFVDSANYVSNIIQVTANTTGTSLVMPDATLVSVGQSTLLVNNGANTVTIYAHDGITVLASLLATQSQYLYLTNNTTTNGSWTAILWGSGGITPVVSVAAVSTSPDLIITGSPITSSGTFVFSFSGAIDNIINVTGNGILTKTGTNTYATRTIFGTANQIVVSNGDGVVSNPFISLAPAISGINSITASNIQIGVNGTNQISTADSNPLLFGNNITLLADKSLVFNDLANTASVGFQAPAVVTTSINYTLPPGPPPISGYTLTSTVAGIMSWAPTNPGGVTSATGTADRISVSPTTGDVVIDIAATYVGQNTITTLGTVTTGAWHATPVTVPYGGTGDATFTAYSVICAGTTATGAFQNVSGVGSAGQVLTSNGAAALPTWQASGSSTGTSVSVPIHQVAHGFSVGQVLYLNGTTYALAKTDNVTTAEVVGVVSIVTDADNFTLTTVGYVTGLAGLTAGQVSWASDSVAGAATATIPTTVGHITKPVWIADTTTSAFVYQERGKIIPTPVVIFSFINQTAASVTMASPTGYVVNCAGLCTLTLPATAAVGDYFVIVGESSSGWVVQAAGGQTIINYNAVATSVAGTISSANRYDSISVVCTVANTTFNVYAYKGAPTQA